MNPFDFLEAARVPISLKSQKFGPWTILRREFSGYQDPADYPGAYYENCIKHGWKEATFLLHKVFDDEKLEFFESTVMEDTARELSRHLPIWLAAHGHILITGLGLGCVVRTLLAKPEVEHIDVVEIDRNILKVVGAEFANNPKVALHLGDALKVKFPSETRWDFAWHDLYTDDDIHLQRIHAQLMLRFHKKVGRQGAWGFPREITRAYSRVIGPLLGVSGKGLKNIDSSEHPAV